MHLRAGQINGCSACVESGSRSAKKSGVTDERMWSMAAWREAPHYSDPERAALALAEHVTRIADRQRPGTVRTTSGPKPPRITTRTEWRR